MFYVHDIQFLAQNPGVNFVPIWFSQMTPLKNTLQVSQAHNLEFAMGSLLSEARGWTPAIGDFFDFFLNKNNAFLGP